MLGAEISEDNYFFNVCHMYKRPKWKLCVNGSVTVASTELNILVKISRNMCLRQFLLCFLWNYYVACFDCCSFKIRWKKTRPSTVDYLQYNIWLVSLWNNTPSTHDWRHNNVMRISFSWLIDFFFGLVRLVPFVMLTIGIF